MGMMTIPFFKTNVLTGFKGAHIISGPKVMGDIIKKAERPLLVLGARVVEHFIGQRPYLEYCLELSKRLGIPICATAKVKKKVLEQDLRDIFALILAIRVPVLKVIPVVKYRWSDDASMADGNTSAFCYRFIAGSDKLSNHASGRAINESIIPVNFVTEACFLDGFDRVFHL